MESGLLSKIILEFVLVFGSCSPNTIMLPQSQMPTTVDPITKKTRYAYGHISRTSGTMKINQTWWKTATLVQKRELVFHELGHLCLGLDHPIDPWEYTIMNQIINVVRPDGKNWDELVTILYWSFRKKQSDILFNPKFNPECNR